MTVRPGATVAEAARLMDRHEITCLLVTGETGELLGVVGPRNLLQIFLRPDGEVRAEIIEDVLAGYLRTNLPAPERDEPPIMRGTYPPVAARRLT